MSFWQNLFYNKSTARLRQMLESVRMRDYTLQYAVDKLSGEERRMAEEINAVIREFREAEHQRVGESHFYDALLSTVDTMLIATDDWGKVKWMNKAAIEGLCGFRIQHLDSLNVLTPGFSAELLKLRKRECGLISYEQPGGGEKNFIVSMVLFFSRGIMYRLFCLQRADSVLQQSEVVAQQKLIKVLTHEIMNSLTPIISLSGMLNEMLAQEGDNPLVSRDDEKTAIAAINRRATGLLQFVQNYRMISDVPAPQLQLVRVDDMIQSVRKLLSEQLRGHEISIEVHCPNVSVQIDRSQIEQVLINLLKNATEAKATEICLTAKASDDGRWVMVTVSDNGEGFLPQAQERLFTPFFTTKKKGQGIGLALCKQMITNHGGTINAKLNPEGNGAIFTVRIPV